ncbi:uncharacterized protein LOC111518521 [Drosophila willistoni]|uniref:uncharacterized protein LOC111518521 n=1 Tax=Drosophila willistoni TaxID=7260 RepID=UPI000C26D37B|nr:uncharacterized protein LOC111518521 [Drosophila willistoni]
MLKMPIIMSQSNHNKLKPHLSYGLELIYTPLHFSVQVTTDIISAIGHFLYCLWSPPLRHT